MIFSERDRVIYREGGVGPPRHGTVIGIGHAIEDVYFIEIPRVNGMTDCVTAEEGELSKKTDSSVKMKYVVAQENELEKEKR